MQCLKEAKDTHNHLLENKCTATAVNVSYTTSFLCSPASDPFFWVSSDLWSRPTAPRRSSQRNCGSKSLNPNAGKETETSCCSKSRTRINYVLLQSCNADGSRCPLHATRWPELLSQNPRLSWIHTITGFDPPNSSSPDCPSYVAERSGW